MYFVHGYINGVLTLTVNLLSPHLNNLCVIIVLFYFFIFWSHLDGKLNNTK